MFSHRRPLLTRWSAVSLPAALAAIGTSLGSPLSLPLHDALGRVTPPRPLPAAIIEVEQVEDLRAAVQAARAAGASSVWTVRSTGTRGLDALAETDLLAPGADGKTRLAVPKDDQAVRLPLPEGLDGVLRLSLDQLGPGTPPALLDGMDAVIQLTSEPGPTVAVPGRVSPVPREEALAVALGSLSAGGLRVLPLSAAVALVALSTALWGAQIDRWRLVRGAAMTAALLGATIALCALFRYQGMDLPVSGLFLGLGLAYATRLVLATNLALDTLDEVAVYLNQHGLAGERAAEAGPSQVNSKDPERARALLAVQSIVAAGRLVAHQRALLSVDRAVDPVDEVTSPGFSLEAPVDPTRCVYQAVNTLPAEARSRVALDLRAVPLVRARSAFLVEAIKLLLTEVSSYSDNVRVVVDREDRARVAVRVEDDSGGLPQSGSTDPLNAPGPLALAARQVGFSGGELFVENRPGVGVTWKISLSQL